MGSGKSPTVAETQRISFLLADGLKVSEIHRRMGKFSLKAMRRWCQKLKAGLPLRKKADRERRVELPIAKVAADGLAEQNALSSCCGCFPARVHLVPAVFRICGERVVSRLSDFTEARVPEGKWTRNGSATQRNKLDAKPMLSVFWGGVKQKLGSPQFKNPYRNQKNNSFQERRKLSVQVVFLAQLPQSGETPNRVQRV